MIVGCYSMDLYCDFCERSTVPDADYQAETFTGQTAGSCRRKAREAGWRFRPDDKVECPACVKGRKGPNRRSIP